MRMLRGASGLTVAVAVIALAVCAVGCRADKPEGVPHDALRVAGGRPGQGGKFDYAFASDGTAYVSDDWDNSLVWSGPVHAGDRIGIDVYAGKITVNGQAVLEHRLRHTDHLVFVARSAVAR